MDEKIRSRVIHRGDPCESAWPPDEPSGDKGVFYFDKETGKSVPGYPPDPNPKLAKAPAIIQDTIPPYYHPSVCRVVESRSQLNMIDKACGTITTDKQQPADPTWQRQRDEERKQDRRQALHKAVGQIDVGTMHLPESVRHACKESNEKWSRDSGMDCFNVAGRKRNAEGKRYRRYKRQS